MWYVVGVDDFSFYSGDGDEIYIDSVTDDLSLIIDPDDCPSVMGDVPFLKCGGQEGEDPVDLWFELLYVGYTEDEAFEMSEMVIGEGSWLGWDQPTTPLIYDKSTNQESIN